MEVRDYTAIDAAELLRLYSDAGWTAYTADPAALTEGFRKSLLTLAAYEGAELLGLLRAVGDGATVVFVQDLLVFQKHRRKGVGTALLRSLLDRFPRVRQIQLTADATEEAGAFYRAAGFRPLDELGCRAFAVFR